jgi:hypothetical protein
MNSYWIFSVLFLPEKISNTTLLAGVDKLSNPTPFNVGELSHLTFKVSGDILLDSFLVGCRIALSYFD